MNSFPTLKNPDQEISIFWFRRDLRLEDHLGLSLALQGDTPVLPIFIFDPKILDKLPKQDARVQFIVERLQEMQLEFRKHGSELYVLHQTPAEAFEELTKRYHIKEVHTVTDYEPYAIQRDKEISALLEHKNISLISHKDQVIFEKNEVTKADGSPYVVFTPYKKQWMNKVIPLQIKPVASKALICDTNTAQITDPKDPITLEAIGFEQSPIKVKPFHLRKPFIEKYNQTRDYPSLRKGTSSLSPHLRFGTVGIRTLVATALECEDEVFLSELIWREFFMQIIWHFPHTTNKSFKPKYDAIEWVNNPEHFERWKAGTTGYPLVDAGMRELKATGYMHNRVRMLVASFLCKHLLIDWRWGEAYFAEKLLDYEQSSNVGNWQWAAGSGVDAAPYFRIFNPITQVQKFDKELLYIKTWVRDFNELTYPSPIVDHKKAREKCLSTYKAAVS